MAEPSATHLGAPDIKVAGLQIWVHGRQFPDSDDYWDSNWLSVAVHCASAGASVWANGPIIHLSELENWYSKLKQLQGADTSEAALNCMEPALCVALKAGSLGQVTMEVAITPDHMSQRHWFRFGIDQTYTGPLVRQLSRVLEAYPIRGQQQPA